MNFIKRHTALAFFAGTLIMFLIMVTTVALANPSTLDVGPSTSSATSTPVWAVSTGPWATTTFVTTGVDSLDLGLQLKASSTEVTFNFTVEFSQDGIDWYGEDLAQTSSATSVSHASTTLVHTLKPSVTTLVKRNITINPIGAPMTRVVVYPSGGNGSVWMEVVRKKETR